MKPNADKEPKKNCFAYNKGECNVLKELVCSYKDKCTFYTDKADVNMGAIERAINNYSINNINGK